MPLLKRKKVRQLPVPPVTLPPPTDVEAYLAADPVADAVTQEQQGGRREAFDGVVLPSPYPQHDVVVAAAADASTTTYKVWQPSREALRLLPPSTPHTSSNPDENGQENTDDDAQLRTLLLLKQKQADALASSSRNESPRDRDTGKVPLEVGKWREDEVWYIKQTGEIFHDYE
ncbi:hypothetical protein QFC19_007316 [Naganishia cerealis]|uniref:Uncharacterized protein n=1 Tax=Naganishia cerealis TaxID=610337 RepID=A0ACC2VAZ5_9TREE|nr:hypothetical protein QFC19_007316 [Naganishia cerealis]